MYMQDELYSYLTYSGGHPQFYLGYTLNFSKSVVTLLGTSGFAKLYSPKSVDGMPYVDLKCFDITLRWQRELFFLKPLRLTFAGGLTISEWYTWKCFVLLENSLLNRFNTNITAAGLNAQLQYTSGKHTISAELTCPLLLYVSRIKEYSLDGYGSKMNTIISLQNVYGILAYAYKCNRRIAISAFYQLHYMHYPVCYKLNTSSDNIGLLMEFTLLSKMRK
jgi:hypothetical protein